MENANTNEVRPKSYESIPDGWILEKDLKREIRLMPEVIESDMGWTIDRFVDESIIISGEDEESGCAFLDYGQKDCKIIISPELATQLKEYICKTAEASIKSNK